MMTRTIIVVHDTIDTGKPLGRGGYMTFSIGLLIDIVDGASVFLGGFFLVACTAAFSTVPEVYKLGDRDEEKT